MAFLCFWRACFSIFPIGGKKTARPQVADSDVQGPHKAHHPALDGGGESGCFPDLISEAHGHLFYPKHHPLSGVNVCDSISRGQSSCSLCGFSLYASFNISPFMCRGGGLWCPKDDGTLDTSDLGRHTLPREECRDGKDTFYFSAAGAYLVCVLLLSSMC